MASGIKGSEYKWGCNSSSVISAETGSEYPTTCRLLFLKSTIRVPSSSAIYASLMFHSSGTVQSSTLVPDSTSTIFNNGINRCRYFSVVRTPSPVILRQIGNKSRAHPYICSPISGSVILSSLTSILSSFRNQRDRILIQHFPSCLEQVIRRYCHD